MSEWKTVRLGDVCEILNGYAFKSDKYVDSGIRVIRITNVQKGFIEDNSPAFYPITEKENIKDYELYENDLLISLTGNVGRVAQLSKEMLPAALNQRVGCIRIKDNNLLISYLFTYLNSDKFESDCVFSARGIAQKNMSTEWLKKYLIPLPSIEEQKKIALELEKCSKLISKYQKQLLNFDTLIKSRFIEMFDNYQNSECQTLETLCSIITDGTHQPPKFTTTGIPFLFVSNIAGNKLTYETEKFISEETYKELYKRTPIEIGDILLSTVGSYGHPAIVENDKKFLFQRHIAYLKPKKDFINSVYFHGALLSPDVQKQIEERVKGIAQKTLNLSEIRKITIPVPPIEFQNTFADFVQQVDKSKFAVQKSLEKAETLYKSLMQEYFG